MNALPSNRPPGERITTVCGYCSWVIGIGRPPTDQDYQEGHVSVGTCSVCTDVMTQVADEVRANPTGPKSKDLFIAIRSQLPHYAGPLVTVRSETAPAHPSDSYFGKRRIR